jgi:hypothetical protein
MTNPEPNMKRALLAVSASLLAALGGCAIVPYEPAVVYAAPVQGTIVVQPSYGYYGHHRGSRYRHWR